MSTGSQGALTGRSPFTRARLCTVLLATLWLSACKIELVSGPGGMISTESGTADCAAGETCIVDVENGSVYYEVFTAVPDTGHVFVG